MSLDIPAGLLDRISDIARRAGDAILEIYGRDFEVETKSDESPVTEADRKGEEVILAALRDEVQTPYPIVAEESVAAGRVPEVAGTPFWLVDPLDGTKEFVKRRGQFTVNIGLVDGRRPVLGVVHVPVEGITYLGGPDGAFAETAQGRHPISCREAPADGLAAVVSKSHRTPETDDFLARFTIADEVSAGSSLKFCRVATGEADLYPRMGPTMEWDTAAGHAVVQAAGGRVLTLDGAELTYGHPPFRNPFFVVLGKGVPWP